MQFLILAYDAKDEQALSRRMAAREAHMALIRTSKAAGHARYGAAMLDDTGKMIGSMLVVDYPSRADVDAWLAVEPYITGKVWENISVIPCKTAPAFEQ